MELPPRMGQQPGQVAQALGVLDADDVAFVGDAPVLTFAAKHVPGHLGRGGSVGTVPRACAARRVWIPSATGAIPRELAAASARSRSQSAMLRSAAWPRRSSMRAYS